MGERLYDLMMNLLYSGVAEAEKLADEAVEATKKMDGKDCAKNISAVLMETWKDREGIDALKDSLDAKLAEMIHNDEPDQDGEIKGAIEELIGLVRRIDEAIKSMDEAISEMLKTLSESIETTDREINKLELSLEGTEELLRKERSRPALRIGWLSGDEEEG